MISVEQALKEFPKELQDEYDQLEKKIDEALKKYERKSIYINCVPSIKVLEKIKKEYDVGNWIVSTYSDRDGSGLKFEARSTYYDDYNSK